MKCNRILFALAASMLLVSCNNAASLDLSSSEPALSSELTSESMSMDITEVVPQVGAWTLLASDVKPSEAGGYPAPYNVEVDEALGGKVTIECSDVMLNNGKFAVNTIQMKKQVGQLYVKTQMKGTLSFELMYNEAYGGTDATGYPSLFCVETDSSAYGDALSYEPINDNGVVRFSVVIDGYAVIKGNNTYASYFKSISFAA